MKHSKLAMSVAMVLTLAAWTSSASVAQSVPASQPAPASRPAILADFNADVVSETQVGTRKAVRYEHEMLKDWGYEEGAGKRPFIVMEPVAASGAQATSASAAKPPLLVYLHGADGKAMAEIPNVGPVGPEFIVLSLECAIPKGPEGWYGWYTTKTDRQKYLNVYSAPEHRFLAEIEWVARKYNVDRNRIYLCGHSMGGSGSLGLGMARGDIFAAIWVGVPAGVDHLWFRMGFPELKRHAPASEPTTQKAVGTSFEMVRDNDFLRRVSGVGLPDVPPIVNFSSEVDGWAGNQELLLQACHDGRHMMVFAWGPFGHTHHFNTANPIALVNPWLTIRKDQAYPVFTDATSDQHYPGLWSQKEDRTGQINAYFRWKPITDEPAKFQMELWLADSKATTQPVDIPSSSTADITPRRLQKFHVDGANSYAWSITEGPNVVQSGVVRPDEVGLLTIPRVTLTAAMRMLTIEPQK